jgi:hypothetical protein
LPASGGERARVRGKSNHKDLKNKIEDLESKYDQQFKVVFEAMKRLLDAEERPIKRIGFEVKEPKTPYGKKAIP